MRPPARSYLYWVLFGFLTAAPGAQAYTDSELAAQLERLVQWWTGEFDNNEQIVRQSGGGLSEPKYTPHFRIHSHILRIDYPDFGEHVLYIEEYKNGDPEDLYRIRLLALETDPTNNGIRGQLYRPDEPASMVGGHKDPTNLEHVSPDTWRPISEPCAVYLRYEGTQFRGGMQRRSCRVNAEQSGGEKNAWFDYQIVITPDSYWFRDTLRSLDNDGVVWELAPGSADYFQADRARTFRCVINYNANGDMTATQRLTEVELHDQGGSADFSYPDGRRFSLVLHNRAFSTPTDNRFRILRIHENDRHVPLAYGYAGTETERFGFNLGWFYTLCRPAGESIG